VDGSMYYLPRNLAGFLEKLWYSSTKRYWIGCFLGNFKLIYLCFLSQK
jgi:hypothetical protein